MQTKKKNTTNMDGRIWLRKWLGAYLLVPAHVDELTGSWSRIIMNTVKHEHAAPARRHPPRHPSFPAGGLGAAPPPAPTLGDVYYRFLRVLLAEPADVRVVNDTVYLTRGDALRLPLAQIDAGGAALAAHWDAAFAQRVLVDAERRLYDYRACRWPEIAEECLPRTAMATRFVCMQLRLDYTVGPRGAAALYALDVYHHVLDAVTRLLLERDVGRAAATIYAVVAERYDRIVAAWDPAAEMYPGCAADKTAVT